MTPAWTHCEGGTVQPSLPARTPMPSMQALDFRYPVRLSPHSRSQPEDCYDWFFSYGLYDERRQRKIRAKDYPYLTAAAWPDSDRQCLWNITAMCAALIERDDEWDGQ